MEIPTIAHAVTTLQQQGQRVSVRQVHRLTGGSFRDISRGLRALRSSRRAGASASGRQALEQGVAAQPSPPHRLADCAMAVVRLCLPEVQDVLRESAAVLGWSLDQVVRLILDRWGREWLRADTESPGEE